jgi:hypothetical protein
MWRAHRRWYPRLRFEQGVDRCPSNTAPFVEDLDPSALDETLALLCVGSSLLFSTLHVGHRASRRKLGLCCETRGTRAYTRAHSRNEETVEK